MASNDSDEIHKDQELRLRMIEAALVRLTQIVEHFERSDDDKELRLRKIEAAQSAAQALAGADDKKKQPIVNTERIIWGLVCIVAYLLKIPIGDLLK